MSGFFFFLGCQASSKVADAGIQSFTTHSIISLVLMSCIRCQGNSYG
jgi:hypothetical protein